LNKTRAFRRFRAALIKKAIQRDLNALFVQWGSAPHLLSCRNYEKVARQKMRNEGKGRSHYCRCGWCVANKLAHQKRQLVKLNDEQAEYIQHGIFYDEDPLDNSFAE
jgi:hypothetical protein